MIIITRVIYVDKNIKILLLLRSIYYYDYTSPHSTHLDINKFSVYLSFIIYNIYLNKKLKEIYKHFIH